MNKGDSFITRIKESIGNANKSEQVFLNMLAERGAKSAYPFWSVMMPPSADIWIAASILGCQASYIFELTPHKEDFARAYFDERWPEFKAKSPLNKESTWNQITIGREFKSQKTSDIRRDIELIIDGLQSPQNKTCRSLCQFPDCTCTPGRCHVTGEMRGPESW